MIVLHGKKRSALWTDNLTDTALATLLVKTYIVLKAFKGADITSKKYDQDAEASSQADEHCFGQCDCSDSKIWDTIQCVHELKRFTKYVFKCVDDDFPLCSKNVLKVYVCLILNEIRNINDIFNNEILGLPEIKNEIRNIENTITNNVFGLPEFKNEIRNIENTITKNEFGLPEIKNEIKNIENIVNNIPIPGFAANLTTGPVFTDAGSNFLVVKVLNNTNNDQTVTVRVFNLDECKNEIYNKPLGIPANCANETDPFIDLRVQGNQVKEYETQILDMVPGLYAWSSTFSANPPGNSLFTIFRHTDFAPLINNDP